MNIEIDIRISWARVALMLTYVFGVIMFAYIGEWVESLLLLGVVYWTNVAWFHEGKGRRLFILLQEAKKIMEEAIEKAKEPVSEKGEEA